MNTIHIWEKIEIILQAEKAYDNPYMEVDVWADLTGPGFGKRVYGFWDGDRTFRIRILATAVGAWSYTTGSSSNDPGLSGQNGTFDAIEWTEAEKRENPCRRGMVIATQNGHAFQFADGTPVYILADTCWAAMTHRYRWDDDEREHPIGPNVGFKDVVRIRKAQGFNALATISCFPGWQNDGQPSRIVLEDGHGTVLRSAWRQTGSTSVDGTPSAKDMHNEGGRPFMFPGRIEGYEVVLPDLTRINPDYFQALDRKIDHLNDQGMVLFMETVRRDISTAWKRYYPWPDSYARYIHYMFCRYQANVCLYSPIHYDTGAQSIPGREYNEPANAVIERYGPPPFGTLCSANTAMSTMADFGGPDEAKWLTFHQIGNRSREHDFYWYLTEIYHADPPRPALNGEPYYPGDANGNGKDRIRVPPDTPEADLRFRSGLYGNLLSGGLAGYFYGAEGMWGGDIEPGARYHLWDALEYPSARQIHHLNTFIEVVGDRYIELIPNADLVTPNKMGEPLGYRGWAYCAHLPDFSGLLLYFEKECVRAEVRGLPYDRAYRLRWFDPREGHWFDDPSGQTVRTDAQCRVTLPAFPSNNDYGLSLIEVHNVR